MSDEKPNDDFHWKNKLEEIESLPGETFNKAAAWEKLHGRMQGKSRKKNIVWYWAAAACLLLALIIPWLFLANKKENVLVKKDNPLQNKIQSSSSHHLPALNKDTAAVISSLSTEKKFPALPVEKINKINSSLNHTIMPFKIVQDKKEKEEFVTQKIMNNALVPDTTLGVVVLLPEKKKLKVVHINELGDPVEEIPNIARDYDRHSSQVKLINQEVHTNPPSFGNTGFNIFKPKPTPTN